MNACQRWTTTFIRCSQGLLLILALILSGCAATTGQIIPTERPSTTPTPEATPTNTPPNGVTETPIPSPVRIQQTAGPSPTSLFGPTRTPNPDAPTPTRTVDPNAARIEFFTTDASAVAPGGIINLFWSIRNVDRAVIYRLNPAGDPLEVINIGSEGRYQFQTSRRDRGQIDFLLVAGEGEREVENRLSVPLACPVLWFFEPAPTECPNDPEQETVIIEQQFERGRMLYLAELNQVFALFNDDRSPAWIQFENLYNPEIHPESLDNFPTAPGTYQPIAILGFVWRGNDSVRNRLGLGVEPEIQYNGFYQTATLLGGGNSLYVSSVNRVVLQLLPRGEAWQLITAP